jgi:two-component system cell cycle sensor histidine kinase/response regulator CckA
VAVESEAGQGASFHVELPGVGPEGGAAAGLAETADAETATAAVVPTGKILLVEDDPAVCALLRHILEDAGYLVVAAHSRQDAERAGAAHGGATALLLCDLVLPDGSGGALYEKLRHENRALRALFFSGYTDDEIRRARPPAGVPLIRKPLSGDELLARVRSVLVAAPPGPAGRT